MSIIESLINPSFLLFLGVLMMTVSFLVIYFEGKMREQNHKISSMLSLVYTLAEDLNTVTAKVTRHGNESLDNIHLNNSLEEPTMKINITQDNLIYVSDNDVNEDEDEDSDSEDEDEDSEDEELDDDHEVEEDLEEEEELEDDEDIEYHEYVTKNNDIKILKIDLNTINDQDINIEFIENNENTHDELDIELFKKTEDLNDLNEILKNEETQQNEEEKEIDFKTNPNNLEENSNDTLDFKKLSIQKLRSVVTEKGLTNEANKLKKNELLKLLGLE